MDDNVDSSWIMMISTWISVDNQHVIAFAVIFVLWLSKMYKFLSLAWGYRRLNVGHHFMDKFVRWVDLACLLLEVYLLFLLVPPRMARQKHSEGLIKSIRPLIALLGAAIWYRFLV